ncbi:MAG: hypothetical protein HOP15_01900 [Planctomycetes bacterium]|nr:hypothetical protein [Planctomycetota bacterium]
MTSTLLLKVIVVTLVLPGCRSSSPLFQPERAEDMQEAGSVHVAVLAVAPWSDYASALQPDFSLDADQAVAEVARDSRWQRQESFSGAQAGVQSTLLMQPQNPSGLAPATPSGPLSPPSNGSLQFPPPPSESQDGAPHIGPDSMLKYTAATALYQEVQLLNRHIRDAAIPAGFRPYMVRLQLSLMPSRRHAPYDAYTTLSFFIPGERATPTLAGNSGSHPVRSTSDAIFRQPFGNGPKVLPLVVTDNLESSVQSRSFERIRGLTASLLDYEKFTAAGTASSFVGDVVRPMYSAMLAKAMRDEVFGRDLNSLLTVARLSENTLRIRLGAMQEATANYAMVPRNHNITLLLMVPEGAPPLMEVVAKTMLVDTEDGLPLSGPDERDRVERLERFRSAWGLKAMHLDTLGSLHAFAQQNDQGSFAALLHSALPADHPALALERSIWIELVGMRIGDQYASNLFELPGQGENVEISTEVFGSQTIVAEDNHTFTYVTLREARFPESQQVLAVLRSPEPGISSEDGESPSQSGPALVLPAESVKADISRRELRLRFPSLLRWGLAGDGDVLELELTWAGQRKIFVVRLKEASDDTPTGVPTQRRSLEPAPDFERPQKTE